MLIRSLISISRQSSVGLNRNSLVSLYSKPVAFQVKAFDKEQTWQVNHELQDKNKGIDLIRELERAEPEEECPFPLFQQLGVTTNDREHTFNAHCDKVIKYIKMGAINKNIAVQYCHYLAHLASTCDEKDFKYYNKRCIDLMSYLLRNTKDMTPFSRSNLMCNVADTSPENCSTICNQVIEERGSEKEFTAYFVVRLLKSCYKLSQWNVANKLVITYKDRQIFNVRIWEPLIEGLIKSELQYNNPNTSSDAKKTLRDEIIEHLFIVLKGSYRDRTQFITKQSKEFIKALEGLDVEVVKSPIIKQSGRCTVCNTHLPLYDHRSTSHINGLIKELMNRKVGDDMYLSTSHYDRSGFEKFLTDIYQIDKKPIDCVIDGLNIAYKGTQGLTYTKQSVTDDVERSVKRFNVYSQVQTLINTIIRGNFLQNYRKILVIGRVHMEKWPGLMDFFKKHNIYYYSTANRTKDDLLQLFAATLNPKTIIVTHDYLRDHLALLSYTDRIMLERWIDTHQAWICSRSLKPIWPTPFEKICSVDRESGQFHIPLIDFVKLTNADSQAPPPHLSYKLTAWLCCKTKSINVPD